MMSTDNCDPIKTTRATKDILQESITEIAKIGREESVSTLQQELERVDSRKYTLGVVGAFKTGKSTLANAAFLGNEVLFTDLKEATCVPTEITWAEESALEVFPYLEKEERIEGSEESMTVRVGEDEPIRISEPSPQELRKETAAFTEEERETKPRKISRVRYSAPFEQLKDITVIDSPGIDSSSEAIIDSAYRIVPACDTVLFVTTTKAGGLSEAEEEFLRSGILEQGLTRLIVVLNHFEDQNPLSQEARREHVEAVKSKLNDLNRGHLPVLLVDAKSWLDSVVNGEAPPENAASFQKELYSFLRNDLTRARAEKSLDLVRRELQSAMVELSSMASLAQKNVEERQKLNKQLDQRSSEVQQRLDRAKDDFMSQFRQHLQDFKSQVKTGLNEVSDRAKDRIRATSDLSELHEELRGLTERLHPEVEAHYLEAAKELRENIKSLQDKFESDVHQILQPLDARNFVHELGKDIELPPVPAPLVTVVDYLLVIIVSPLPLIPDVLIRLLAGRFPEARKLLPTGLAKSFAQKWVVKQLDQQKDEAIEEIDKKLSNCERETEAILSRETNNLVHAETEPIRTAMDRLEKKQSPYSEEEIKNFKQELTDLYEKTRTVLS